LCTDEIRFEKIMKTKILALFFMVACFGAHAQIDEDYDFIYEDAFPLNSTNHVASFGAFPNGYGPYNGVCVTNVYLTLTSPAFSSSEPPFNPSMIGDRIIINYAGTNGQFYQGIIANVYSSTALGLQTPVANPLTNFSYCIICSVKSELTNNLAFQAWLNSVSNSFDTDLILDPPNYYSQILGSNNVGSCYVLEANWQNPTMNNALLIVPPLLVDSPSAYGGRSTITIEGDHPYSPWGFGPGESFIGFTPNESILVIDGVGNDQTGTNYIGNSIIDGRAFGTADILGAGPNNLFIPNNDCDLILQNFSIFHSYDSHFCTLNLAGFADGTTVNNVNLIGGDQGSSVQGVSYEWGLGHFPASTNDIGIIWPDNFQGTFAFANYVGIYGNWAAMEEGQCQATYITAGNISNFVDFAYSPAVNMNLQSCNLGGVFNVNHVRKGIQMAPSGLFESFIDFGCNVMPAGSQIQLFNDEYWAYDHIHDGFYRCVGEIDFSTNINAGVPLTWTNWDYDSGGNGILLKLYSSGGVQYLNQNISYNEATISNLTTASTLIMQGNGPVSFFADASSGGGTTEGSWGNNGLTYWYTGITANHVPDSPASDFYFQSCDPGVGPYGFYTMLLKTNGSVTVTNNLTVGGSISTPTLAVTTNGSVIASLGFAFKSNAWSLARETADMPNWSYKIAVSNSPTGRIPTPVGIYNSNGTYFVIDPLP
jgi:hypothetical protein